MTKIIAITTLILLLVTIAPVNAQSALGPSMYDHNVPQILYSGGSWVTNVDANNYGGSRIDLVPTTSTAPAITFKVYGDGFTIYITRGGNGGTANISVNGVVVTSVNWFNATVQYGQTISITGLGWGGDGIHDVVIQKTSTTSTGMNLDGLYVAPHVTFPTYIPPTSVVVITMIYPTPANTQVVNIGNWAEATIEVETTEDPIRSSWDVDGQAVAMVYSVDAGQVVMVIVQILILFIILIMMVLFLRGKQAQ